MVGSSAPSSSPPSPRISPSLTRLHELGYHIFIFLNTEFEQLIDDGERLPPLVCVITGIHLGPSLFLY